VRASERVVSETSSSALLAVLASLLLVREAYAYLDPGTGSYILQILIASLFGALFILKVFWGRIVGFFFPNYTRQGFENEFDRLFAIKRSEQIRNSKRILYLMKRR
jgi:hypothetical protein